MQTQYNGYSKSSGVYQIRNLNNGRIYIGSAKRFQQRYSDHIKSLNKGTHHNKFLQNDFNKCGTDSFIFEVLEVVEGEQVERLLVEQNFIDQHYDNQEDCYNFKQFSKAESRTCFSKTPKETRQLISQNSKNMWNSRTNEEKLKLISIMQSSKTEETKLKISKAHKGKKLSQEHIEKIRVASTGRTRTEEFKKQRRKYKHTEEAIEKISNAR